MAPTKLSENSKRTQIVDNIVASGSQIWKRREAPLVIYVFQLLARRAFIHLLVHLHT